MINLARVEEHEELRKDIKSGAVLLSDTNLADDYRNRKAMMSNVRDVSAEINNIKKKLSDLESVKTDMQEIKELLKGLVK